MQKEIIIVDDSSTDGTRDLLKMLENDKEIKVVYHPENRGKGASIRTALKHVTSEIRM